MKNERGKLPIVEIFASIQGEGYFAGSPAAFIRMAGCDVGCTWCDSVNSWDAKGHPQMYLPEIVNRVELLGQKMVVITGGEPLMYELDALTFWLHKKKISLHLETSGAYKITGKWDWICWSPKRHLPFYSKKNYKKANELKIVIAGVEDLAWAETIRSRVKKKCKLYLQPEWSGYKDMVPVLYKYILKNPHWNISLQLHKFMDIP